MSKRETVFVCQKCGEDWPKWSGRCPSCGEWNSLVETVVSTTGSKSSKSRRSSTGVKPVKLAEVKAGEGYKDRLPTGMGELDRVLGGGIVAGSAVLVAGEPGIGKSTLLTQLALRLAALAQGKPGVLYVCGEESPEQVKLRVERLASSTGSKSSIGRTGDLLLLAETDVDQIVEQVAKVVQVGLVIVDSVQALSTQDLAGMAGSVGQVRESAGRLIKVSKGLGIPLFLVGHVTKEGAIAGPKVLEHMVDVVLSLEGEREHDFRILRALKNRFGATDEVGVFAMSEAGMKEVANPSDVFLQERQIGVPGSVVAVTVSGLRPMLVEIQALVVPTQLAIPRRVSTGIDQRKVQLLTAVLQKRCGLGLGSSDIFVNVAGGLTLNDPGADLGVALAIASSFLDKPLPARSVAVGEVGLLGEIRQVRRLAQRVGEAKKLGYALVVGPEQFGTLRQTLRVFHKN
jgi:DNA repair protein RadA/Sms